MCVCVFFDLRNTLSLRLKSFLAFISSKSFKNVLYIKKAMLPCSTMWRLISRLFCDPSITYRYACCIITYMSKWKCLLLRRAPLFVALWTCRLPGSSVHGILHVKMQEWVAIPFSRGSSQLKDWTQVSCIAGKFFTIWVTREGHVYTQREASFPGP